MLAFHQLDRVFGLIVVLGPDLPVFPGVTDLISTRAITVSVKQSSRLKKGMTGVQDSDLIGACLIRTPLDLSTGSSPGFPGFLSYGPGVL